MPRVSVLLPARDAEATVGPALRSILRQRYRDLELVAVDDGSRDGTRRVLEELAARDRRVRIVNGPGQGIVAALEAGRARCTGELVARMDADDLAHPLRLEVQVDRLDAEPELAAVGARVSLFPRRAVAEGMRLYVAWIHSLAGPDDVTRERFVESPLVHPAALIRAGALAGAGGYRERGWPEDYDLWLTLLGAGARLANVQRRLLFWREHPERLTRTDGRYAKARHLELKAHHLAAGPLATGRGCALWGAGETGRALGRSLRARGIEIAYFVDVDPAKIGRHVGGSPVLGPGDLPARGGPVLLVAVAVRGARALVRSHLAARGWVEGADFLCCA